MPLGAKFFSIHTGDLVTSALARSGEGSSSLSEAELRDKIRSIEEETRRQRIDGEINHSTERSLLSKFGICMRDDSRFPCMYLADETYIKADSREINKLLLTLKFGYSYESVHLIDKHLLDNRDKARKRGGEYKTKSELLEKVIGLKNIPPQSFYHPYQNDMIKQCFDKLDKSDPIDDTKLQDLIAKNTAFTAKKGKVDKDPEHII